VTAGEAAGLTHARPSPRDGLAAVRLDDEVVLYDEETATLHHLNAAATMVWERCDGRRTLQSIAIGIARDTGAALEVVQADVEDVVGRLVGAGLLVVDGDDDGVN
jgi:hypothetical protein